ncbi:MAG: toprim domain-containing protein [Sphingobium sp.]
MTFQRDRSLNATGAGLVERLGGAWHMDRGMCLCPAHADTRPSLSVRAGSHRLLFKCFAGCSTRDILQAIRLQISAVPYRPHAGDSPDTGTRWYDKQQLIAKIWRDTLRVEDGPSAHYLSGRGLTERPDALRFHPRAGLKIGARLSFRPAIIAAVREGTALVALQRLFLDPRGHRLAVDLPEPRRTLGRPFGGAVQLRPAGQILGLAEGVETAMSAAALLGIPVWSVLGAERLHQIAIPKSVERLVLLPDKDLPGRRAAGRSLDMYRSQGLACALLWPWRDMNDWNDVLLDRLRREGRGRADGALPVA